MSGILSDNEIYSSPIPIRGDESSVLIPNALKSKSKSKSKSSPKNEGKSHPQQKRPRIDDENSDISLWSEAKRQSWASIETNPNAFFYRHCAPGEKKRNGAWDAHEKKLFLETVKLHPPSQGWGLFAQHIPGRVGYQCRNFYHRLLESGEVKALPEELEKMQRSRKKKDPQSNKKENQPHKKSSKVQQTIIAEEKIEEKEIINLPDLNNNDDDGDEEASQNTEDEEPTLSQVQKLHFTSHILNTMNQTELELKSIPFFKVEEEEESEHNEYNVIKLIDYSDPIPLLLPPIHQKEEEKEEEKKQSIQPPLAPCEFELDDIDVNGPQIDWKDKTAEQNINIINSVFTEKANDQKNEKRWTPRMKEPWKTLTPEQIGKLRERSKKVQVKPSFQYESAKILAENKMNPLNLLLLSLPVEQSLSNQYINAVRDHLVNADQNTKNALLQNYFKATATNDTQGFVEYVINSAKHV